jgi:oxygen-independent coproporphyrinogen-3 oxidase
MVNAICKEIALTKDYLNGEKLESIYFGGGTPSLLSSSELVQIFEAIHKFHKVEDNAEITFESNPDDSTPLFIKDIMSCGINRLSIGIQSFNNEVLQFLHRVHDSEQSQRCVKEAQDAGLHNISIDLIYGIQSENHEIWRNDLELATKLSLQHISSYCLTIEPKTVFGKWLKDGTLKEVEEEFAAVQFEMLTAHMEKSDFAQYEISNFCKKGKMAVHNSNYWRSKNYLGIGPGAHSYNGLSRQSNVSNNIKYIRSIEHGEKTFEIEELSEQVRINEYIMTSLRTIWGCDLTYLSSFLSFNRKIFENNIATHIPSDLILKEGDQLKLTSKGKLLADEITSKLFL